MAYTKAQPMLFVETSVFTRRVTELMDDDSYRGLQEALTDNPSIGAEKAVNANRGTVDT